MKRMDVWAALCGVVCLSWLSYPRLEGLYEDPGGWLEEVGENADLYRLTLDLIKKQGDWLTRKAHLEPFRGYGFGEGP